MSNFKTPAPPDSSARRKVSTDLGRLKNFPSALSLRKRDPDTPPRAEASQSSGGTFSRLRAFSQAQRPSASSLGSEQADTSMEARSSRRTSRLLDAFKPSKKPAPSFEVIRKPTNRSTTSFHSSSHHPSPNVDTNQLAGRSSAQTTVDAPVQPAPRISLSAPRSEASPPHATSLLAHNVSTVRPPYPPSTSKTRKSSSSNPIAAASRTTSDPYLNLGSASNSRAQSPSQSPNMEATNGSFSLHSFRNVRSTSDVSIPDPPVTQSHSRVQSMISVDEYVTPGEELPEPRFPDRDQSTSPAPSVRPASISAAKFRQASRQRSESGTIPTIDTVQAGGSGLVRPPRSRTPSQDLAAMEAVLAQTNLSTRRSLDADRHKSTDLAHPTTTANASASNTTAQDPQRRKRGFFIVVEGLDRAGKSTQVERLAEHLQAKAIKFPERTTAIGQMINSYLAQTSDLDDQAIHLLFSANRWECVASIHRTLEAGESIVCDRYAFSGIAYSVAKGLAYDWCRNPDVGLPLPDLTMFLDLDAQTAAARGGYGEERYEKLEFQAKVREAFSRVSQDVRNHGGRWVTIDASKTLDQVTDDIQKAVQRVTSSIDRVGAKLGRLFVSERPPNVRAGSSSELFPPSVIPNVKRSSMSSEGSARQRLSLDLPRISTTSGNSPASRPSGSPLTTYSEQLAAVRAAAAGTLSGLFGGSSTTVDQPTAPVNGGGGGEKQLPDADGPSPLNAARGLGFDSARVLAKYPEGSGRRRTLIDVIGEIEGQQSQTQTQPPARSEHRRSMSATAEFSSPTLQSPVEGFPSTFAQAGRVRRSTDQSRVSQLPTIVSSGAAPPAPTAAPRSTSLTVQQSGQVDGEKPLPSASNMRASSFSSAGNAGAADGSLSAPRASTLSPTARTASPAFTTSSRSSLASPPLPASNTPPIARPASTNPADHGYASGGGGGGSDPNLLSSQHLSMLNVQQSQAEMQEQYMRNYMAMMANPMMAQQAHYQMMLQRHQQQYYGRAASAIGPAAGHLGAGANGNGVQQGMAGQGGTGGGPPLAAFMQPMQPMQPMGMQSSDAIAPKNAQQRERRTHSRTQSSTSLYDKAATTAGAGSNGTSASTSQPMLSMMMAPPPPAISSSSSGRGTTAANAAASFYPSSPYNQHAQMFGQPLFYPNAAQSQTAFPQTMGGGGGAMWTPQQQAMVAMGGYNGRPGYPSARSEIATPTGLRSQRHSDVALRGQQPQPQPQQQ